MSGYIRRGGLSPFEGIMNELAEEYQTLSNEYKMEQKKRDEYREKIKLQEEEKALFHQYFRDLEQSKDALRRKYMKEIESLEQELSQYRLQQQPTSMNEAKHPLPSHLSGPSYHPNTNTPRPTRTISPPPHLLSGRRDNPNIPLQQPAQPPMIRPGYADTHPEN